ncbi:MAG: TetR/AcrR family transcriptional regulator [Rickettsiales bacterium]
MARRSDHSRDELKALMIKAGLDLIRKDGLSGFSARKVAGKVGYTVGSVYHVFGSYDTLMLEMNAVTLDALKGDVLSALERTHRKEPLQVLANGYYEFARKNYAQWTALFEYRLQTEKKLPEWYRTKLRELFCLIEEQLLAYCMDSKHEARRHAYVLWAGIHGICVLGLSGRLSVVGGQSTHALIQTFLKHYVMGIKAGNKH